MESVVAYLRVSTQRQQRSGLGIEAQRAAIARFAEAEGLTIIGEYVEAESGKGADALDLRPQLAAAPWLRPEKPNAACGCRSSTGCPAMLRSCPFMKNPRLVRSFACASARRFETNIAADNSEG